MTLLQKLIQTRQGTRPAGPFDPQQRQTAATIERDRAPWWVVWWGVGPRRFWAVPTWPGAPVPIVDGRDVHELHAAMTAVESGMPLAAAWSTR